MTTHRARSASMRPAPTARPGPRADAPVTGTLASPPRRGALAAIGAAGLVAGAPGLLSAQTRAADAWPSRPVKFLCPFSAGGATDILSRLYCERMSAATGQQFIVENRTGAGGTVAMTALAKAAPDGYTIGMTSIATNVNAKALFATLPYDMAADFSPISGLWRLPNLLVISPKLTVRSVPELIELCRADPGRYTYASSGVGTTTHVSGEFFRLLGGLDIRHVPYRGGAPATVDLMGGIVDMYFDNITGALQAVKDGKLRGLAVTTAKRSPVLPDLPAMGEILPGFDVTSWTSVSGPAGLPPAISQRMSEVTLSVLQNPAIERRMAELGATSFPTTPAEIVAYRAAEEARLLPALRQMGIKPE